ncbi:MAG: DUF362 domain-containing protein [Promethearchaeota archaeon]|nr:MAG: DUF362 domain-containing protein [Candidatus Lokiarchaeota archaeon]
MTSPPESSHPLSPMSPLSPIALQKIKNDDVRSAIFKALEDIGAAKLFPRKGMNVLLKPNILSAKPPERGVTTHPLIVKAVIQWVKQFLPARILVCDSSGGKKSGDTARAMKASGIQAVCDEENAECVPFETSQRSIFQVKNPLALDHFASSSWLTEADVIINLPKIKTHELCKLTCCIKNMFGTILLSNKAQMHTKFPSVDKFSAALVDVYAANTPHLTVVDGYIAMEGYGPAAGDPVDLNLIIAGYDGFAIDHLVCEIIGLDPESIEFLRQGIKAGLGHRDLSQFQIIGETIKSVYRKFKPPMRLPLRVLNFVPKFLLNYVTENLFHAQINFDPKKCTLCGTCWDNCPVEALSPPSIRKRGVTTPEWSKKTCITCYCCSELCPYEAIKFTIPLGRNVLYSRFGATLGILTVAIILALIFWK